MAPPRKKMRYTAPAKTSRKIAPAKSSALATKRYFPLLKLPNELLVEIAKYVGPVKVENPSKDDKVNGGEEDDDNITVFTDDDIDDDDDDVLSVLTDDDSKFLQASDAETHVGIAMNFIHKVAQKTTKKI
ncbi:hypothetical protein KVT40_008481 [Elsinoe batatas]|uniref:Uncharacterized protein n=1 Tax=Elsinoe batatas TaxID=2601811 RepID=A0A8K0P9J7_9PEZI|nr:hypothetical protein KVT40_008481 [Elsinoe batatas]